MIREGSPLTVDRDNDKDPVVSLREIAESSVRDLFNAVFDSNAGHCSENLLRTALYMRCNTSRQPNPCRVPLGQVSVGNTRFRAIYWPLLLEEKVIANGLLQG